MKLTLGFSPCPNDTFIFDALVNGKLNTGGLEFEPVLEDVQTLNNWAANGKLDVTKLSFPALFAAADFYEIIDAGAALGDGVGPLLVGRMAVDLKRVDACTIAIPGANTTANFLLQYAFPTVKNTKALLFSDIEDAVCNGQVDLGVLIHENRFTYQQKGLHKLCDLGDIWQSHEGLPIPLGCIAVKRSLPASVKETINQLVKKSVANAQAQTGELSHYVVQHAQAMDKEVMRKHIALYVNQYTFDLGAAGKAAIEKLYAVYCRTMGLAQTSSPLFLTQSESSGLRTASL